MTQSAENSTNEKSKKKMWIIIAVVVLVLAIIGVIIGVCVGGSSDEHTKIDYTNVEYTV